MMARFLTSVEKEYLQERHLNNASISPGPVKSKHEQGNFLSKLKANGKDWPYSYLLVCRATPARESLIRSPPLGPK